MQLPQLIYGSSDRGSIRGYGLLGRSPGIDERIVREFCRWSPSHGALQGNDASAFSLNFFPLDGDQFIVSRTVYGGPEYSGRGGLQVVTIGLLLSREQLSRYNDHPLQFARTAIALGHVILPDAIRPTLPTVTLPSAPLLREARQSYEPVHAETAQLAKSGRKVMVLVRKVRMFFWTHCSSCATVSTDHESVSAPA